MNYGIHDCNAKLVRGQSMESRGILYFGFRDMFALINKKGMEVVMHFLFSRLNSHLAYEEFRY